ncbi:hypothetical protein D3C81_1791560 [compost metagenome]
MTGNIFKTAQTDRFKRLPDCPAFGRAVQGAQPGQVFFGAEQVLDAGGMANPQEDACQLAALLLQRLAMQQHLAVSGPHQPGEQAQQAGLAAAIGAADLQHVAGTQVQFKVFEQHSPVALTRQRYGFELRSHAIAFSMRQPMPRFKSAARRPL